MRPQWHIFLMSDPDCQIWAKSSDNMSRNLEKPPTSVLLIMSTVDNTLGAILIGGLSATGLFGISCLQTFNYYIGNRGDTKFVKIFVGLIFIGDIAHEVSIILVLYWYLITNFDNPSAIARIPKMTIILPCATLITDTAIRLFFLRRIWILSDRNYLLCIPLAVLNTSAFGFLFAYGIKALSLSTWVKLRTISWFIYSGLSLVVVADFYIAISLCYLLHKIRSGIKGSDSMVSTIIVFTIHTGLLTSVTSLVSLIMYTVSPHTFAFLATYFNLSKLYFNATLGTLNARQWLRSSHLSSVNKPVDPRSFSSINHAPWNLRDANHEALSSKQPEYPLTDMSQPVEIPGSDVFSVRLEDSKL